MSPAGFLLARATALFISAIALILLLFVQVKAIAAPEVRRMCDRLLEGLTVTNFIFEVYMIVAILVMAFSDICKFARIARSAGEPTGRLDSSDLKGPRPITGSSVITFLIPVISISFLYSFYLSLKTAGIALTYRSEASECFVAAWILFVSPAVIWVFCSLGGVWLLAMVCCVPVWTVSGCFNVIVHKPEAEKGREGLPLAKAANVELAGRI